MPLARAGRGRERSLPPRSGLRGNRPSSARSPLRRGLGRLNTLACASYIRPWRCFIAGGWRTVVSDRFDAVVIGGGPGGTTAAILLARAGWAVAVVERMPFPRRKVCGEYVSATNLPLLRLVGLEEAFRHLAGPEVTHFGLYARDAAVVAEAPPWAGRPGERGRAIGREHLDTLLLANAVA